MPTTILQGETIYDAYIRRFREEAAINDRLAKQLTMHEYQCGCFHDAGTETPQFYHHNCPNCVYGRDE